MIIAQGPRQIIAGITVYALLKSAWTDKSGMLFIYMGMIQALTVYVL